MHTAADTTHPIKALGGALIRSRDGWHWIDGSPEHRVRDAVMRERAPTFERVRVATGSGQSVAIPRLWRSTRFWPNGVLDESVVAAIETLVVAAGQHVELGPRDAFSMDDYGLAAMGWLIDVGAWNDAMGACCDATWAPEHDTDLRARARGLVASRF